MTTRPGYFCDVCAHPEGVALVYATADGSAVVLEINGVERGRVATSALVRYLRCAALPDGTVGFVGQDQDGRGLIYGAFLSSGAASVRAEGEPCYAQPAIRSDGTTFVLFTQITARSYRRIVGLSAERFDIPVWPGGDGSTSQGFLQVDVDGREEIRFNDPYRTRTIRGTTILCGVEAHGWIFGQDPEGGFVGIGLDAGDQVLAMDFNPEMPRACWSPVLQKWAVCSYDRRPVAGYAESPFPVLIDVPPVIDVRAFDRPMFVGVFDDAFTAAPANTPPIGPDYGHQYVDLEYAEDKSLSHAETWGHAARPRWIYAPPSHRAQLASNLMIGDEVWTSAYRQKGESVAAFRVRVMTDLEQLATLEHPIEIVAGACDFSALTEAECLECFPIYRELCDVSPWIRGVRFFAWDRGNGVAKYPSFKPWISAFVAASSGVPDQSLPAPPPVPTPKPTPPPAPLPAPIPAPPPKDPPMPDNPIRVAVDVNPLPAIMGTIEVHGNKVAVKNDAGKYFEINSFGQWKWADGLFADGFGIRGKNGVIYQPADKCFIVAVCEVA